MEHVTQKRRGEKERKRVEEKKSQRKSLPEQHSADIAYLRHVAQYRNTREVKVCKYRLIAESCFPGARGSIRRSLHRGCIERGEESRVPSTASWCRQRANDVRDIPSKSIYTWIFRSRFATERSETSRETADESPKS